MKNQSFLTRATRLLPLFLLLVLPAAVQGQFTYQTNNGGITITSYRGSDGTVIIPSTTNGLPVTCIGDWAFEDASSMTNVTIPGSVTNIGAYAFSYCSGLTGVTIPGSVIYIGLAPFVGCSALAAIAVETNNPAYVSLEGVLFNYGQTTLIQCPGSRAGGFSIPSSVTNIEDSAFDSCSALTSVNIPGSVICIASSAFRGCRSLTNVMIPSSVTSIDSAPFPACSALAEILVDTNNPAYVGLEGVLFDKNRTILIQYPGAKAGGYTIPNSVTDIGDLSFYSCLGLTSVTIPDSVTLIRSYAFSSCRGLTNVTMGNHVSDIGYHAFAICISLPSVTIPNTVTNIGQTAFEACSSLTSVTIPASVAKIGDGAFTFCSRLAAIIVDTNNPAYLSLDGVMFSKDQTTLIQYPGGRAGSYTVPNSVTNLGNGAFDACVGLTGVYFQDNAPGLGWSVFYADELATVYFLPGTTGWGPQFGELSTALWRPQIQTSDNRFGVRSNQFGFDIAWASGMTVVVEASGNLANHDWTPVQTNTLTGPSSYFSDPQWTNYPSRFYRLRWP